MADSPSLPSFTRLTREGSFLMDAPTEYWPSTWSLNVNSGDTGLGWPPSGSSASTSTSTSRSPRRSRSRTGGLTAKMTTTNGLDVASSSLSLSPSPSPCTPSSSLSPSPCTPSLSSSPSSLSPSPSPASSAPTSISVQEAHYHTNHNPNHNLNHDTVESQPPSITKPKTKRRRPSTPFSPPGFKPGRSFSSVPFPTEEPPIPSLPNLQNVQTHANSRDIPYTPPATPKRKPSLASPLPPNTPIIASTAPPLPRLGKAGSSGTSGSTLVLEPIPSNPPCSVSSSSVVIRAGQMEREDKDKGKEEPHQPHQELSTTTFPAFLASSSPSNAAGSPATIPDSVRSHLHTASPGDGHSHESSHGLDKPNWVSLSRLHTNTPTVVVSPFFIDSTPTKAMDANTTATMNPSPSSPSSTHYTHTFRDKGSAHHPSPSTSSFTSTAPANTQHPPLTSSWSSSHALKIRTGAGMSVSTLAVPDSTCPQAMMKRLLAKPAPPSPSPSSSGAGLGLGMLGGSESEGFAVGYTVKKTCPGRGHGHRRETHREQFVWEEEGEREADGGVLARNDHEPDQERSPTSPTQHWVHAQIPIPQPQPAVAKAPESTLLDQPLEMPDERVDAHPKLSRKSSTGASKRQRNVLRRAKPGGGSVRNANTNDPYHHSNSTSISNATPNLSLNLTSVNNKGKQPTSAPALTTTAMMTTDGRVATVVVDHNHNNVETDKGALRRSTSASGGFAISGPHDLDHDQDSIVLPGPFAFPGLLLGPESGSGPPKPKTKTNSKAKSKSKSKVSPTSPSSAGPSTLQSQSQSRTASRESSPSPHRTRAPIVNTLKSLVGSSSPNASVRRVGTESALWVNRKGKGKETRKEPRKENDITHHPQEASKNELDLEQLQSQSQIQEREPQREQDQPSPPPTPLTPAGALIEAYKRRQAEAEKLKADLSKSVEVQVWDADQLLLNEESKTRRRSKSQPEVKELPPSSSLVVVERSIGGEGERPTTSDSIITLSMAMEMQGPKFRRSRSRSRSFAGLTFPPPTSGSGSASPLSTLRPASPRDLSVPSPTRVSPPVPASASPLVADDQKRTRSQSHTLRPSKPLHVETSLKPKLKTRNTVFGTTPVPPRKGLDGEWEMYDYERGDWSTVRADGEEKEKMKAKEGKDQGYGQSEGEEKEKGKLSLGLTLKRKISGRRKKASMISEDERVSEERRVSTDVGVADAKFLPRLSIDKFPLDEPHDVKSSRKQPETPRGDGSGNGIFWRLVRKISVGGGLKERYHESASASATSFISAAEAEVGVVPPVPALPASHAYPSSPNRAAKRSKHAEEHKDKSRTPAHDSSSPMSGRKASRPSNTTTRSSSPVTVSSSDKASASSKFFNRTTPAGWSSTSSFGEEVPPLPKTIPIPMPIPTMMLAKHIIPPSELVKLDDDPPSSVPIPIPGPGLRREPSMGGGWGEWTIVRSPEEELPSLPLPPRKGKAKVKADRLTLASSGWARRRPGPEGAVVMLLETGLKGDGEEGVETEEQAEEGEGEKTPYSPTIPEFSNDGAINAFSKASDAAAASGSTTTRLQPPPRPARSMRRPHPLLSLTRASPELPLVRVVPDEDDEDGDYYEIHTGKTAISRTNTVSTASTARASYYRPYPHPHRRSSSFSAIGGGVGPRPGSSSPGTHQRGFSSPVTPSFPSPSFRSRSLSRPSSSTTNLNSNSNSTDTETGAQHESGLGGVPSDQEKADKWAALLRRSDRAGGTLHLAGGQRVLASERLSVGG